MKLESFTTLCTTGALGVEYNFVGLPFLNLIQESGAVLEDPFSPTSKNMLAKLPRLRKMFHHS